MNIVDFMIHLKPELPMSQRMQLESEIGDMNGVMSAHFSSRPHLMEVAYDPDIVNSDELMGCVSRHGIVAQKIGL